MNTGESVMESRIAELADDMPALVSAAEKRHDAKAVRLLLMAQARLQQARLALVELLQDNETATPFSDPGGIA
jgi:hypothetical protein